MGFVSTHAGWEIPAVLCNLRRGDCMEARSILARKARIARFPQAEGTIYSSSIENRVIDLSVSYHSCHSWFKKSCRRFTDIVSFVPFVQTESRHSCQQKHEVSLQKVKSQDNRKSWKRAQKRGTMSGKRELMGRRVNLLIGMSSSFKLYASLISVEWRLHLSWMKTPFL